ncbi:MAG: PP2C family protein-serine/threonine phosphatase [Candidatus Acidiferrales bacterium]
MNMDTQVVDVSQDWAVACEVQERSMQFPRPATKTLTYAARCRQLRAMGGDCFDFLPLPGRRLAFAVGDASGKGLAAALMIANVQSSLRTALWFSPNDVAAAVAVVNRQVYASSLADRYATLFFGIIDEGTLMLRYVNAGHNPPIIIRGGGAVARLEAGGPPVGVFAASAYAEGIVQLKSGDRIIAYTDGVIEAEDGAGKEWGLDGLLAAVTADQTRSPDKIVEDAFAALDGFSGGFQSDDTTILVTVVQ